jgi:hypothetical protein
MPRLLFNSAVALVVLSAMLPPTATMVAAGAPPCECHHGVVVSPTPRCYCACEGDYLMPFCRYTTTQRLAVEVWFIHDANSLNADIITDALQKGINNGDNVTFIFSWRSFNKKTMMRYSMTGSSIFHLRKAVSDNLPWIVDLGIDATYEAFLSSEHPVVARPEEYVLLTVQNMVFTVDAMAWLLTVVLLVLLLLMVDRCGGPCCGGRANDADEIKLDILSGAWNPLPKGSLDEQVRRRLGGQLDAAVAKAAKEERAKSQALFKKRSSAKLKFSATSPKRVDRYRNLQLDGYHEEPLNVQSAAFSPMAERRGSLPRRGIDHARLTRFYEQYNPEMIPRVDEKLKEYEGREHVLFAAVVKKYGPQIADSTEPSEDSRGPTRSAAKYHEEPLNVQSMTSFSPTTDGSLPRWEIDHHARLTRFYAHYNPEMLPTVDEKLKKYEGREDVLFAAVVKKYGPEIAAHTEPSEDTGSPTHRRRTVAQFEW